MPAPGLATGSPAACPPTGCWATLGVGRWSGDVSSPTSGGLGSVDVVMASVYEAAGVEQPLGVELFLHGPHHRQVRPRPAPHGLAGQVRARDAAVDDDAPLARGRQR